MPTNSKPKLFIDADDTILKSSEAVIKILNNRYNINPPKTYDDLNDWGYRSIYSGMDHKKCEDVYQSDEFFDTVEPYEGFVDLYNKHIDDCEFYVVTKGNPTNIAKKIIYFNVKFPGVKVIGCDLKFDDNSKCAFSKSHIDMTDGIQIDDRADCLATTNANAKVLFTHNREFTWNNTEEYFIDNRYDCGTWDEINEIIDFALEHKEFFEVN